MMVMIECGLLSLVGIALGILLGGLVVAYFGKYGFSVPGSEEIMNKCNIPAEIFPRLTFVSATRGPLVLLIIALAAAVYPALRAAALRPVEALGKH